MDRGPQNRLLVYGDPPDKWWINDGTAFADGPYTTKQLALDAAIFPSERDPKQAVGLRSTRRGTSTDPLKAKRPARVSGGRVLSV